MVLLYTLLYTLYCLGVVFLYCAGAYILIGLAILLLENFCPELLNGIWDFVNGLFE